MYVSYNLHSMHFCLIKLIPILQGALEAQASAETVLQDHPKLEGPKHYLPPCAISTHMHRVLLHHKHYKIRFHVA